MVQHEMDHLMGKLFVDRMKDLKSLLYLEEWKEHGVHDKQACLGGDVRFPR
jgi:peptide deformylase